MGNKKEQDKRLLKLQQTTYTTATTGGLAGVGVAGTHIAFVDTAYSGLIGVGVQQHRSSGKGVHRKSLSKTVYC